MYDRDTCMYNDTYSQNIACCSWNEECRLRDSNRVSFPSRCSRQVLKFRWKSVGATRRDATRPVQCSIAWLPSTAGCTCNLVTTRSFNCFSHRMIFVWTWLPGYESTAPVADIMGPREQRVPSGSTITLRCVILSPYQTRPIRGVQWLRDNKLLTFQVMQPQLDRDAREGGGGRGMF